MRIRATCHTCDVDFLFFELRNTGTGIGDSCPNCHGPLGVRGLLAIRAEQALAVLVRSLEELGRQDPNFTVRASSVTQPVENALATLAAPPEDPPSPWWKRRRAA